MTTSFSDLLGQSRALEGKLALDAPADWLQGRSLFGGLQAALAVRAMRSLAPTQPLRSLQTNFIAPIAGTIRAEATILRVGKNTTQLEARLLGDQGLATQCMGIFGDALSSKVESKLVQPELTSDAPIVFPFVPGVTPNFIQHFAMRLLRGWRLDTELVSAKDGYTHQSSILWSPRGQALALSRQCMLVFG